MQVVGALDFCAGRCVRREGRDERITGVSVIEIPLFGKLLLLSVGQDLLAAASIVGRRRALRELLMLACRFQDRLRPELLPSSDCR